jgi:hypothetical protein
MNEQTSLDNAVLVIRESRKGKEKTPWLEAYRLPFAIASRAAAKEMKENPKLQKLSGEERVKVYNKLVSKILKRD